MNRTMIARIAATGTAAMLGASLPGPAQASKVTDLPPHYAADSHARPGQTTAGTYFTGPPGSSTVLYVVGDSMAGQLAYPAHLARPSWQVKPRTKSGTAFALPTTDDTEGATWSATVVRQMEADKAAGRRVIALVAHQNGTSGARRGTIHELRKRGVSVRLATSAPLPSKGTRPGQDYTLRSNGIGRWATLTAGRESRVKTLDLRSIVARPNGRGGYKGVVNGQPVYRSGSHVTVGFADKTFPRHLRQKVLG